MDYDAFGWLFLFPLLVAAIVSQLWAGWVLVTGGGSDEDN